MPEPDPKELRRLKALEGKQAPARKAAASSAASPPPATTPVPRPVPNPGRPSDVERIQNLEKEKAELNRQVDQLRKDLVAATKERDDLLQVRDRVRVVENEKLRLAGTLDDAKAELGRVGNERDALRQALKESQQPAIPPDEAMAALLDENRRLATTLDEATVELKQLRELGAGLRRELDRNLANVNALTEARNALGRERTLLESRVTMAEQQLKAEGKITVLPAGEVARLTNEFVTQIQDGLGSLAIRQGELRLKVAFADAGGLRGLVVPTPDSDPKIKESVQEIVLQFDKVGTQPPGL